MADTPKTWRDIEPKDAVDITLPWNGIEGPMNELGERCPWPWDPQQLVGAPLGQYHCPHCGGMQVAGMAHLEWTPETIAEMYGEAWWQKQHYIDGKQIEGSDLWICMTEMTTTWRIMICDEGSVYEFWCYPKGSYPPASMEKVHEFFDAFDGKGDPAPGWVKHHPSERRNKAFDYVY